MLRPDASRRHADVIERVAEGDRPDVERVGVPVREHLDPLAIALDVEVAVAVGPDRTPPHPAPSRPFNLSFEPLQFGLRRWTHPTKYTEWIGAQLLREIENRVAA